MIKKSDANQVDVVKQLRALGCSVAVLSHVGHGFPDLLVGFRKKNYLIELKDGNKVPSKQKLTPDEINFHLRWCGQLSVCNSVEQIRKLISL